MREGEPHSSERFIVQPQVTQHMAGLELSSCSCPNSSRSCLLPCLGGCGGVGAAEGSVCVYDAILEPSLRPRAPAAPDLPWGAEAPNLETASWGPALPGNL